MTIINQSITMHTINCHSNFTYANEKHVPGEYVPYLAFDESKKLIKTFQQLIKDNNMRDISSFIKNLPKMESTDKGIYIANKDIHLSVVKICFDNKRFDVLECLFTPQYVDNIHRHIRKIIIQYAIYTNDIYSLEFLKSKGIEFTNIPYSSSSQKYTNFLSCDSFLAIAMKNGNRKIIDFLFEHCDDPFIKFGCCSSLLSVAAYYNYIDIVKHFTILNITSPLTDKFTTKHFERALMAASLNNNDEIMYYLLESGYVSNLSISCHCIFKTMLSHDNLDFIKYYMGKETLPYYIIDMIPYISVCSGSIKCLQYFKDTGVVDIDTSKCMLRAIERRKIEMLKHIVEKWCTRDEIDKLYARLLRHAIMFCDINALQFLINLVGNNTFSCHLIEYFEGFHQMPGYHFRTDALEVCLSNLSIPIDSDLEDKIAYTNKEFTTNIIRQYGNLEEWRRRQYAWKRRGWLLNWRTTVVSNEIYYEWFEYRWRNERALKIQKNQIETKLKDK